jgi:circadian clock protein KaiC
MSIPGVVGMPAAKAEEVVERTVGKMPTGIVGFDEIVQGGLPRERLTAITGGPGTGKTLFAMQTLVNRSRMAEESGIFVTFEESVSRVWQNIAAFDWGAAAAVDGRLSLIEVKLPSDTIHSGAFDLNGLLATLAVLASDGGARNIVFDGIDVLLSSLQDPQLERQELSRLNEWIGLQGLTALITIKRYGLSGRDQFRAEYLSYLIDCGVILDAALIDTALSRTVRVEKYRGSGFAGNAFPMVFTHAGIEVVAASDARLSYPTFPDRLSTGIARLDTLLAGDYIHGSSILVSGAPGTAKTTLAACFIDAACRRGAKAVFVSFDESDSQIAANMLSIGINLQLHVDSGLLRMASLRSGSRSPEEHFLAIRSLLLEHGPDCLVVDPLSALLKTTYPYAVMISENLLDFVKSRGITVLCTSLLDQIAGDRELSASHVSTIADTWVHVSYIAQNGERNRALTIVKSRGTGHSNQVRELILSHAGLDLVDVYAAEGAVLTGSARSQKEHALREQELLSEMEFQQQQLARDRSVAELEDRAKMVTKELDWMHREAELLGKAENVRLAARKRAETERLRLRSTDEPAPGEV